MDYAATIAPPSTSASSATASAPSLASEAYVAPGEDPYATQSTRLPSVCKSLPAPGDAPVETDLAGDLVSTAASTSHKLKDNAKSSKGESTDLLVKDAVSIADKESEVPKDSVVGKTPPPVAECDVDPNTAALSMFSALGGAQPSDYVVLVGFGRNCFGRFSVSAVFEPRTGELLCEKKYMQGKFSAKRGRRSYAECAAAAAAMAVAGGAPLSTLAAYNGPHGLLAPAPCDPPSLRQRGLGGGTSSSYSHFAYGNKKRGNATGAGNGDGDGGDGSNGTKRGASVAGHQQQATSKQSKMRERAEEKRLAANAAKEKAEAEAAAAHKLVVAAAKVNALIGARNPDNDDPMIPYREAFQDCDTGEITKGVGRMVCATVKECVCTVMA